MPTTISIPLAILASGVLFVSAGCDRQSVESAEYRSEQGLAEAKQGVSNTGDALKQKAQQAGQAIDDAGITTAVKSKFLLDNELKALQIDVDTQNGVVTLTGTVKNEGARARAISIAQSTDGVVRVEDALRLN